MERLDQDDPLAAFRAEFFLPADTIYLNGNSLGAMPLAAAERGRRVVEHEWAEGLIGSMNTAGWFDLPQTLGRKLAPLIGAEPHEVVLTDATGINLYKIMAAALGLRPDRRVVVMEGSNFPTNNYMIQGLLRELDKGHTIRFAEADELLGAIDDDVAAICITHVHYKSGLIHDMAVLTARAQEAGAIAVWDLCHSAGIMPIDLNGCGVDFAVGCSYKYLNGGPGAPSFLFAAERHHGKALQPLTGWYGHAEPFAFERDYRPAGDIRQMLTGTQPTASLAMAEPGIDMLRRADIHEIRAKSERLTGLFIELVEARSGHHGLELASPRDAGRRGSQVSFTHADGYAIVRALHAAGVICDYREPGIMRFGFSPLYIRYVDAWDAAAKVERILAAGTWQAPEYRVRKTVT
ncbi:MAG: kynureninase [Woeseiaceae bacterium]|nr:kynureninase [Woeseiaceae bacterium]